MPLRRIALAGVVLAACTGEVSWEERAYVSGRYLVDDGDLVMGFPGSEVRFRTEGEVALDLVAEGDRVAVEVREDGGPWTLHRLESGANTLELNADGTPSDIRVVKVSEDWQGRLRYTRIEGEVSALPVPASRQRILFIGDSITAGSGTDLAALERGELEAAGDNARLAFPQGVAERLGAEVHQIAYGGRGILRDWENKTYEKDGQLNAPQVFQRAVPSYPEEWDHCRWVPDAVVVGLGTNDFNPGIPERDAFVGAMVEFIGGVQDVSAPGAPVLLMVSPMFGEGTEKRRVHEDYLAEVAARVGPEASVVDVGHHPGHPSTFGHPVAHEHEVMADVLARDLATRLANSVRTPPEACRG